MTKKRKNRISNSAYLTKANTAPTARVNADSFRVSTRLAISNSLSLSLCRPKSKNRKINVSNDHRNAPSKKNNKKSEKVGDPTRPKMMLVRPKTTLGCCCLSSFSHSVILSHSFAMAAVEASQRGLACSSAPPLLCFPCSATLSSCCHCCGLLRRRCYVFLAASAAMP